MPPALTVQLVQVPPGGRDAALARLRRRRAHCRNAGCRYWVFGAPGGGTLVEFVEAPDEGTLRAALAGAPDPPTAREEILHEVELERDAGT